MVILVDIWLVVVLCCVSLFYGKKERDFGAAFFFLVTF